MIDRPDGTRDAPRPVFLYLVPFLFGGVKRNV